MSEDFHILRLGYHDRANLLPLLHPLKAGWVGPGSPWKLEVVNDIPSALLEALLQGSLDAAFVTPAAAQLHGDRIAPVGGWGLATEGSTYTALMLSPQRLDLLDGGDVAVLPEAAGTTAEQLLRTMLTPYYGIKLTLRQVGEVEYRDDGARLLYSDGGARQTATKSGDWVAEDMGLAWWVLTGLPAVWELLCAPRDLQTRKPGAQDILHSCMRLSLRSAAEQNSSIIEEVASRLKIDPKRIKELFSRQSYTLGPQEQKGLARFLDMAARARAI